MGCWFTKIVGIKTPEEKPTAIALPSHRYECEEYGFELTPRKPTVVKEWVPTMQSGVL